MPETIYLKPLSSWEQAQAKRKTLSKPLQILTSLKTTAVLGATLGALLNPAGALAVARGAGRFLVPKSAKGLIGAVVGVPLAVGVLSSSKKAREIVSKTLNPVESIKRGKKIGEIIEEPSKASDILGIEKDMSVKEKIIAGAKSAGKAGALIAGGVAVVAGVKKVKSMLEARKEAQAGKVAQLPSQIKQFGFTEPQPVGLGGVPVAGSPQVMPSGAPGKEISKPPIQNIIQIQIH